MIFDRMENAALYKGIHKGIAMALDAMAEYTPENYPSGKVVLDGDNVFLLTSPYQTKDTETPITEAHRQYIDVMYMVDGEEIIHVKPVCELENITKEYDPSIDALLADTDHDATPVRLQSGSFVILFPQDAHAPACCVDTPMTVKKIVGKVKL